MNFFLCLMTISIGLANDQEWQVAVTEAVRSIETSPGYSYRYHRYADGGLKQQFPEIEGSATLTRSSDGQLLNASMVSAGSPGVVIKDGTVFRIDADRIVRAPLYRNGTDLYDEMLFAPHFLLKELKASAASGTYQGVAEFDGKSCYTVEYEGDALTFTFFIDQEEHLLRKMSATGEYFANQSIHFEMFDVSTSAVLASRIELPADLVVVEYSGAYPKIGDLAPEFSMQTFAGVEIKLADLRGKVVVLDFWATWCRPCLEAMPHIQALHESMGEDVRIIGLNHQENGDAAAYLKRHGYSYANGVGDKVAEAYKVNGLPFVFVIDREGILREFFSGYYGASSDKLLLETIKKWIPQSPVK